jgi:sigma-E factor negative regulatory protein RseB
MLDRLAAVPHRNAQSGTPRRRCRASAFVAALALALSASAALAEDSLALIARAAEAARMLNYAGTIVYQYGNRIETSRLIHLNDRGTEGEKLVNLDGPPREVVRTRDEVRCYYPDAKVVRVEPRTFRNAFPSLSAQQQKALGDFFVARKGELSRVAGLEAQEWLFEPRDRYRYRQKFWIDVNTGLLLKVQISNDRNETVEQFAFTDLTIGGAIDWTQVRPTWAGTPPDWALQQLVPDKVEAKDTGWLAARLPPGFAKTGEGFRNMHGKRDAVAHLMYSDGLVAVSVFVEPVGSAPRASGHAQVGGVNVYVRQIDDHVVTALGEAPGPAVRTIANGVTRR